MMLLSPGQDMTDRDFDALRVRLVALVRSSMPSWTDFEVASFGTTLLELFAFVGDTLAYYQDHQGREARLQTATQRKNVIALARMLGYRMHGSVAATADVDFELERVPVADVTIPAGTEVRTPEVVEPVRFRLQAPFTIRAGQDPARATGTVEHAETHEQRVDTAGLPGIEIVLDRTPYLDGSLVVATPLGDYVEVDSLLGVGPADRQFEVLVDQSDRATVRFGDGRTGMPPAGTVVLRFKTGGGGRGNVDQGRLKVVEGSFSDAHGHPVQLAVSNPRKASGGVDRETIAQAKMLAPRSLRATSRSVTRDDYETHALQVPAVARALLLTSNEDPLVPENSGDLLIVPAGGGLPSTALLEQVRRQVTVVYPGLLTFQVQILPASYLPIGLSARIQIAPGVRPSEVTARVRGRLAQFFAIAEPDGSPNPTVDFGYRLIAEGDTAGRLAWSDVLNVIIDTPGVRRLGTGPLRLLLNGSTNDVPLGAREFPVLGQVTLIDAVTGQPL